MKSIIFSFIFGVISLFENQNNFPQNLEPTISKEVISFESIVIEDNKIKLNWFSLYKEKTEMFVIQNSKDGKTFIDITMIVSSTNEPITSEYDFIDVFPNRGKNYYRLKVVDFDGQFEYSKTIITII